MVNTNIAPKEIHLKIICKLLNTYTAYLSMHLCELDNVKVRWNVKILNYVIVSEESCILDWCMVLGVVLEFGTMITKLLNSYFRHIKYMEAWPVYG